MRVLEAASMDYKMTRDMVSAKASGIGCCQRQMSGLDTDC